MRFPRFSKKLIKINRITIVNSICLIMIIVIICISRDALIDKALHRMFSTFAFIHKQELKVMLRKTYVKCNHGEVTYKKFDSQKSLKAYARALGYTPGNGNLKQKTIKSTPIYTTLVHRFCETCKNNRFLGIRANQVVVIYGTPKKPGPIQENTGIELNKLPSSEAIDLKNGIPLKDNKEKLQIIEGLRGLFTN